VPIHHPSRQLSIDIRVKLPIKSLIIWRGYVKGRGWCGGDLSSPKGDASGVNTTLIDGASRDFRVEQLFSELKQLKVQRKIDKLKKKLKDSKNRELASFSSSNEETDASSEEEAKGKRGRKEDKKSYNTTFFNYDNLPPSNTFTSVPVSKAPVLMGRTIPNGDTR
jgi:hypothetical protein